jgi:hypothetical protein
LAGDGSHPDAPLRALHRSSYGGIAGGISDGSWREAKYWTWIECVAWLATHDEKLMTRLKALELRLREGNPAELVRARLRDALETDLGAPAYELEAKNLIAKLEDRSIAAIDSRSLKEVPPSVWGLFPRSLMTGASEVGAIPPGVLIPRADILKISPGHKPVAQERSSPRGRGRRKGAGGHAKLDIELVKEMRRLIESRCATSIHEAATKVASRARGGSAPGTREKRLCSLYKKTFGDFEV